MDSHRPTRRHEPGDGIRAVVHLILRAFRRPDPPRRMAPHEYAVQHWRLQAEATGVDAHQLTDLEVLALVNAGDHQHVRAYSFACTLVAEADQLARHDPRFTPVTP